MADTQIDVSQELLLMQSSLIFSQCAFISFSFRNDLNVSVTLPESFGNENIQYFLTCSTE